MPDFNFDAFNHDEAVGEQDEAGVENEVRQEAPSAVEKVEAPVEATVAKVADASASEEVDKW